jgi:cytochrome b
VRYGRLDDDAVVRRFTAAIVVNADPPQIVRARVWDAPTRIVHWTLVLLVAVSWWTAENDVMDWHRYSGYVLLGFLVFRVYWGFAGSSTARFTEFVKGPRAVWSYVKRIPSRSSQPVAGHNPLGGWSVLLLLAAMLAQVGLGLFAVDVDGIESGPLSHLVSFEMGRACAQVHENLFNVLLTLVTLHVVAVAFYLLCKRQNLITPMVDGNRDVPLEQAAKLRFASRARLLAGICAAALLAWIIANGLQV